VQCRHHLVGLPQLAQLHQPAFFVQRIGLDLYRAAAPAGALWQRRCVFRAERKKAGLAVFVRQAVFAGAPELAEKAVGDGFHAGYLPVSL